MIEVNTNKVLTDVLEELTTSIRTYVDLSTDASYIRLVQNLKEAEKIIQKKLCINCKYYEYNTVSTHNCNWEKQQIKQHKRPIWNSVLRSTPIDITIAINCATYTEN